MVKVSVKIIDLNKYKKLTGETPKKDIIKIEKKEASVLVKQGAVELSEMQRAIESKKETKDLPIDKDPQTIKLLQNPNLMNILVEEVQKKVVGEKKTIKTVITICVLSKVKNKRPASTNLCLNALSGVGKDFVSGAVMDILPDEVVISRRRVSEKVMDYLLPKLEGKDMNDIIIALEDVQKKGLNGDSMKTLLTAKPDRENVVSTVVNGEAVDLKIFGKPTFIFTSAKADQADETLRRVPFCFLNETPEQTQAINYSQAKEDEFGKTDNSNPVIKRFFLGLEKAEVLIPKATEISLKLSNSWIKKAKHFQVIQRTSFPRFLDFIKGSAVLFQHQREKDAEGRILAKFPDDYNNAREILLHTTSNALMIPISRDQRSLVENIVEHYPEGGTAAEINVRVVKWEERWLRRNLDRMVELGFLGKKAKIFDEGENKPKKPVGLYVPIPGVFDFQMPTWNELCKIKTIKTIKTFNTNNTNKTINQKKH